jgi:hypothetical protein
VLDSWSFPRVIATTEELLINYPIMGKPLGFREGTFLYCMGDSSFYLIAGGKANKIVDPVLLEDHQLKKTKAMWVSPDELALHEKVL